MLIGVLAGAVVVCIWQADRIRKCAVAYDELVRSHEEPIGIYRGTGISRHALVLGDSMAVGVGATAQSNTISFLLHKEGWNVDTVAAVGSLLVNVPEQIKHAPRTSYDLIIMFAGPNDMSRGRWAALMKAIPSVADSVKERLTKSGRAVWVVGDPCVVPALIRPISLLLRPLVILFRNRVTQLAERAGLTVFHACTACRGDPFWDKGTGLFARDFYHPNDQGYAYIFEGIRRQVLSEIRA